MGAGKSFFARKIAQRYSLLMKDMDLEIELFCNEKIPEIFKKSGEQTFRKIETRVLAQTLKNRGRLIVATGGGLPLNRENQKWLKRQTVIFLNFPFEQILCRIRGTENRRPLLKGLNRRMVRELWRSRLPGYLKTCDYVINSEEKLMQLVERLIIKG